MVMASGRRIMESKPFSNSFSIRAILAVQEEKEKTTIAPFSTSSSPSSFNEADISDDKLEEDNLSDEDIDVDNLNSSNNNEEEEKEVEGAGEEEDIYRTFTGHLQDIYRRVCKVGCYISATSPVTKLVLMLPTA